MRGSCRARRLSVHMSWCCPVCRTEVLHIVTEEVPDPSKTYCCQGCRFHLWFSWALRRMQIASFQPDHSAVEANRVRPDMRVKRTK